MKYCPDCGGELNEEGVCQTCGFDTTGDLEEDEDDDEDQDWGGELINQPSHFTKDKRR